MERVFVTGGSGFVGRALLRELARRKIAARALARSATSRRQVEALGAEAVEGDLDDRRGLEVGMEGCDTVVHAAAWVQDHGPRDAVFRANVGGTENVIAAARSQKVARLVHVGTEAVLADGRPIVRADESRPFPARPAGLYPLTKGLAERAVRAAAKEGLHSVVVRPRFIWGRDDTSLLPKMVEAVKTGRWRWIDGGRYLTSTCHVDNVVEGILCAAERGAPGGVYFLTDGAPVEFRAFVGDMLRAAGVEPGEAEIPRWLANGLALATSWLSEPPLTATALALMAHEVTVVDERARTEIAYRGHKTIAAGLAELRDPIA